MSIIIFIAILAILVLIHELGHFIAAKQSGVLVEEFGFGFPPRLFSIKKGETVYSFNLFPLGGFVKLYGEEYRELDTKQHTIGKHRAFVYKTPWQKISIIVAGVLMNAILGIAIFYITLSTNSFKSDPLALLNDFRFAFGKQEQQTVIVNVTNGSPAEKSGLQSGDIVMRVKTNPDGKRGNNGMPITSEKELIKIIQQSENIPLTFEVVNIKNNAIKEVIVTPLFNNDLKRTVIGVSLSSAVVLRYETLPQKVLSGFLHSYNVLDYSIHTISQLFRLSFKEKSLQPISESVSGPIGIFHIVDTTIKSSGQKLIRNLLDITGLLSLSLALMNIVPFPALDGGRLLFIVFEGITKRRIPKHIESQINTIGFFLLIALAVLISVGDIIKLTPIKK